MSKLSKEEKKKQDKLFLLYRETQDQEIRNELVLRYVNLARSVANKFKGYTNFDDLFQVGMVGLIKAVERFDIDRGIRFITYATISIMNEIKNHFRDKNWGIKVPQRIQKKGPVITKITDSLTIRLGRDPRNEEIIDEYEKVFREQITIGELTEAQIFNYGSSYRLLSLEIDINDEGSDGPSCLLDFIGSPDLDLQMEEKMDIINSLPLLKKQEQRILVLHYFCDFSVSEIAKAGKRSRARINAILDEAREKLRIILGEKYNIN